MRLSSNHYKRQAKKSEDQSQDDNMNCLFGSSLQVMLWKDALRSDHARIDAPSGRKGEEKNFFVAQTKGVARVTARPGALGSWWNVVETETVEQCVHASLSQAAELRAR